jgi:predicted ATPase
LFYGIIDRKQVAGLRMDSFNKFYIRKIKINRQRIKNADVYPFCLPVVRNLDILELAKPVTFLVGENGTGKSTLLEAIAVNFGFNAEGGSKNFDFSTQNTHSDLYAYLTLEKGVRRPKDGYFFRAESFYNLATEVDNLENEQAGMYDSYGGRSLHAQSHGESFLALMLGRFRGEGLYILDEPEAALSPMRQMTLLSCLDTLVKENSQLIISTHSPILLSYPDADILVLSESGIIPTPYKETEHYMITKMFLDKPEKMLKELLDGE